MARFEQLHRDLKIALLTSFQHAMLYDKARRPEEFLIVLRLCATAAEEASQSPCPSWSHGRGSKVNAQLLSFKMNVVARFK